MNKAIKETTPVEYSGAAVKILHFKFDSNSKCFNLHWHERVEIIRVKKGRIMLNSYGNTLQLKEGDMIVFTPRMAHEGYTVDDEVEYDVLMFDLKMFYNQTAVCNQILPAFVDGRAKFETIIYDVDTISCVDQICNSKDADSLEIISLIYKLIYLLFEKHLREFSAEPNIKLKPIIDYIEENYSLDISTATISKKFGYSAEHFCRVFKEATGITPMKYLRIYRLEQSLKMIKANEYTIGEIASQCGFYDANYFTRCFKALYGVPPRRYKPQANGYE